MGESTAGPLQALWHDVDGAQREVLIALLARLAKLPLFARLSYALRTVLIEQMQWLSMPAGAVLFVQGGPPDALYVLLHGRLTVSRRDNDGSQRLLGCIEPGGSVGEHALMAEAPHLTTVTVMRDSELLCLPRSGYAHLLDAHPLAMHEMAKHALRRSSDTRERPVLPRCFALLPAHRGINMIALARSMAQAIGVDPQLALVTQDQASQQSAGWFSEREARAPNLIYVGNDDAQWRERCLRQSDWVLIVVDAACTPDTQRELWLTPATGQHLPQHLVLLHQGQPPAGVTRPWRAAFPNTRDQHHIRKAADVARMVRRLQGRALGLVLSGGGARGFAHIGVIRALREAGLEIDYVAGASIGAIMAAGIAADWSLSRTLAIYRRGFVRSNPLSDWTLPLVALRRGHKVASLLRGAHGEIEIEDLPIPFFCVSSDLTDGRLRVHDCGPLWRALRASCAIPGLLPPVFHDGHVLVDGGVIDNLPVAQMHRRMVGAIVAVDVGSDFRLGTDLDEAWTPPWWQVLPELWGAHRRPGLGALVLRAGMVSSDAATRQQRRLSHAVFQPPLESIDLLAWKRFDQAVELGYRYTLQRLTNEPELIERLRAMQQISING
ncbi:MAG: hypothetical protein CVV12_05550 [Gammaproteobacteria bacterium HGW-Gammaproteobacteria-2]|jgi:NTE family protein|nr:MAG: hypothetical protein CVV12_05550 [Gammaproteobacteria bacterium HGW-Gammaproteobacteria-2]